jgi:transcriptional regulator with XRE-family HTH domain
MSRVAERLKKLREASGLTQEELEIHLKNEKKN